MKKKIWIIAAIFVVVAILTIYKNTPPVIGGWTKQTLYLWILNSCHIQAKEAKARVLLVDDDSGDGIFTLKRMCDELHMKATFAAIPTMMDKKVRDSLIFWQDQGYEIAIHGYNHDNWRDWEYNDIITDIDKSEKWLLENGFNNKMIKYVVAPRGSNTRAVRKAIRDKGYRMISSANILNPDTTLFQYGRVLITKETSIDEIEKRLKVAKKRKLFVIFGTHSSNDEEFSEEKTKVILQIAKEMGFEY